MSLMSLMLSLAKKTSDNKPLPSTKPNDKNPNINVNVQNKSSMCMIRIERVRNLWWLIWNTLVDVIYFLATIFFLRDSKNPFTPPTDIGYTPKRIVHRTVSLDDIKLIARATKTVSCYKSRSLNITSISCIITLVVDADLVQNDIVLCVLLLNYYVLLLKHLYKMISFLTSSPKP